MHVGDRFDVFTIMQGKRGKLWFATIDGVYIYDGKTFTLFLVNEGAGGLMSSNNNLERILEDNTGNIWFGGRVNEGVFRYDGRSLINLKVDGLEDRTGHLWVSIRNMELCRYDGKTFIAITENDNSGSLTNFLR